MMNNSEFMDNFISLTEISNDDLQGFVDLCMYVRMYVCIHVYIYVFICVYVRMCVCMYV
jgi:hypothetical protein